MKVSELWLQEWIRPALSRDKVCERMTMAGLEIESVTPVAVPLAKVIVGKVTHVKKLPDTDRLSLCEVDVGRGAPLSIVCGADNVKPGVRVPTATEGAVLPNNITIKKSQIRGVFSEGMLCSAYDLGMAEKSEGLIIFPDDAPLGAEVWDYLQLNDTVIDVSITPNRGDCLSVMGLANEISALTQTKVTAPDIQAVKATLSDTLPVVLQAPQKCSHYVGRIIKNVKADAMTPIWMQERLRRSGQRSISPVVDVMNYVMLELGQPMHAFDLATISNGIHVRTANESEKLALLDGQTVELTLDTLVIADNQKPLAIAGVMGGLDSSVTLLTKDIFLESAYFQSQTIAHTSRSYHLNSESSYRFERGVDSTLQVKAIERATELLLKIVGGEPGPVIDVTEKNYLPTIKPIHLREARVKVILGMKIAASEIENIFTRLGFHFEKTTDGWNVTATPARSDISLEVDLIEEIIRVYGADRVPTVNSAYAMKIHPLSAKKLPLATLRHTLSNLGYQEIVTYTFVDKKTQLLLNPSHDPKPLLNPITADMDVMRTNLWPGLVKTLIYNLNRQQNRIRLFESGLRFVPQGTTLLQERVLSGLISGPAFPPQWGIASRQSDFFDLKGDLQVLLNLTFAKEEFTFKSGVHPALHPGQTAEIFRNEKSVGFIGGLHPTVLQMLSLPQPVFVFEVALELIEDAHQPKAIEVSKFPEIRRDIAIFVDRSVPVEAISGTIKRSAGEWLQEVNVFDVYQGKGVPENQKSIALSLTLQHASRTLVDDEVVKLVERVIVALKDDFAAELRK